MPQSLSSAPPRSSVASAIAIHGSLNPPMKMICGSGDARKDVTAAGLGRKKRDCFRDTWKISWFWLDLFTDAVKKKTKVAIPIKIGFYFFRDCLFWSFRCLCRYKHTDPIYYILPNSDQLKFSTFVFVSFIPIFSCKMNSSLGNNSHTKKKKEIQKISFSKYYFLCLS